MAETITAIYEKGVLRPLQPLNLREQQQVHIQIVSKETSDQEQAQDEIQELIRRLIAKGWMRSNVEDGPPPPDPVSEGERRRLADLMGQAPGKPLSEIIIEERGEW